MDQRRAWQRWVRLAVIALVVGAIVNVLVAWAIPVMGLPGRADSNYGVPGSGWPVLPPEGWPEAPDYWSISDGIGFTMRGASHNLLELARTRRRDGSVIAHMMAVDMYGLPMRSLRTECLVVQRARTIAYVNRQNVLAFGVLLPEFVNPVGTSTNRLAFIPMWPGFAVNTVVYAILAAGVVLKFDELRARRRRVRGRCVSCNYTLAGLTTCPECGRDAPIRCRPPAV